MATTPGSSTPDDRAPVTARARLGEETEGETQPAESRLGLHDDGRTTTQSPVGDERPPGLAEGQHPALGERDRAKGRHEIFRQRRAIGGKSEHVFVR